jgi:DNA polymerase-1
MPKLLLLDGHSLAYRAFYALPTDLATPSGTVTNAVYGFTSMLVKLLADEQPDAIAVAFDAPGGNFRFDLDPEYKAGRKETPDLFRDQLPLIREVLTALKIPMLNVAGVEADDVIATLATRAAAEGTDVIVVTGDRDSYQLVEDPHIKVLYNRRGVSDYVLYDEAGIVDRVGVHPRQYTEYAALRGDTSDNLPGVPGIGEKTAATLVNKYGRLESIFEHLDELPPKQRQNLGEYQDRVLKNREMSVLRRDVDCGAELDDLRQGAWDREEVRTLFDRLAFRLLLPRLHETVGGAAEAEVETFEGEVRVERDAARAGAFFDELRERGTRFVVEPHWAATPGRSALRGVAFALGDAEAVYIPGDTIGAAAKALQELVGEKGGAPLIAHRAKELIHGFRELGVEIGSLDLDTAILAYLLDPGEGRYVLETLALRYLSLEVRSPDAEAEGKLALDADAGLEEVGRRAMAVFRLASVLEGATRDRELTNLYVDIERPLVRVLADMEDAGVRVDLKFLTDLAADLGKECAALEHKIQDLAGEPFKVNSTPQLRRILYEKLGLTPTKKTKTGASTDADSLQKLAGQHPIIEELLRWREVEKLRNTYADALPPLVAEDGRIHAVLNQTNASTGRISSENPNLQNIPVRTSGGLEMRKAFIPADGTEFLVADYSQIELRVLAHLAEDPGLIEAFSRDADVHTTTAARVFGVEESAVAPHQRRFAKVVNYGLAYGMEAYGLGQRLDIAVEQAREILDAYFASFPNVKAFMEETVKDARSRGYTTTLFGRRRQLPELADTNYRIRMMGERMAQNAPVQGTAADIFKLAMVNLDRELHQRKMGSRMILTVHDELVLEVPFAEHDDAAALVPEVMESVCTLNVPLKVDVHFGATWAEAKS